MSVRTWSLRDVAHASGVPFATVSRAARSGILPTYQSRDRVHAQLPEELADALGTILRHGAYTPRLGQAMVEDPRAVLAAGEALVTLAHAALAQQQPAGRKVA